MKAKSNSHWTKSLATGFALVAFLSFAQAEVLIAPEKAMQEAFPGAQIQKRTLLLSGEDKDMVQKRAGDKVEDNVYTFFEAKKDGQSVGFGGLYTSRVRTKTQTVLYMITPKGELKGVEVIAFYEPPEYAPSARWLEAFKGKALNERLAPRKDIPMVTGATLTSQAVTRGARVILAVWERKLAIEGEKK